MLQYQKVQLNSRPEGRWNTFNCSTRVSGKLWGSSYTQSIPLLCLATAQGSPVLVFFLMPSTASEPCLLLFLPYAIFLFWFSSIRTGRYMGFYLYYTNSTVSFHLVCIIVGIYMKYHVHLKCCKRAVWTLVPFLHIFTQLKPVDGSIWEK